MAEQTMAPRTFRADLNCSAPDPDGKVTISDPVSNRHYLVNSATLGVLRHFDGTKDPSQVLATLTDHGLPVTETSLARMIERADGLGFFQEVQPAFAPVAAHLRGPSRRSIVFWKIAEFDPDRSVQFLRPVGRALYSRWTIGLLAAAFAGAIWVIWINAGHYVDDLAAFGLLGAWLIAYAGNVVVTLLHEYGHALAVGRYGGHVHRMGVALYLFSPAAYTDASSAWAFKHNRERIVVTLAGVYVEGWIFLLCVYCWGFDLLPGVLGTANFLMAHVLIARIVFNLNPFLRLDGYWLVSDLLHITNMRAKAFTLLLGVLIPWKYREKAGFTRSRDERTFLLTYAIASLVTLVIGLALGLMFLNQLARMVVPGYTPVVSRVVLIAIAVLILASAWRYAISLLGASYVRSGQSAKQP